MKGTAPCAINPREGFLVFVNTCRGAWEAALGDNTGATWRRHCSTALAFWKPCPGHPLPPDLGNDRAMTGAVGPDHQIAELKFGMAPGIAAGVTRSTIGVPGEKVLRAPPDRVTEKTVLFLLALQLDGST